MSLYRQAGGARRRATAMAGLVVLLVGGAAGFAIGRGTADEPSLKEQIEGLRKDVQPALGALELVGIEYPEAVEDGEVVAESEYQAALSQAQTAVSTLEEATDLGLLSSGRYDQVMSDAARVVSLIEKQDSSAAVERAADRARAGIDAILSGATGVSGEP